MTTQDRPIVYKFDAFTLDLARGILLSADRREVPLRAKSLTLLQFMLDRAGHLVSREEIMKALWPRTIVVDDSISQCVRDIRRALGGAGLRLLRTMHRRGYLFAADVIVETVQPGPLNSTYHAAERRDVTSVVTDLQGYTALAEMLEPHMLASLLDEYLNALIDTVAEHGGTVLRIVGDGLSILFGAPTRQPDHAARAVACAVALDQCAEHFRTRWATRNVSVGVTRIGIASGPASIGNFGTGPFQHYSAHGETINTASRLENANKELGTRICMSASVVARVPDLQSRVSRRIVRRQGREAVFTLKQSVSPIPRTTAPHRRHLDSMEAPIPDR